MRILITAFFVFLASGCATLVSGTSQSVLVDVINAKGATCTGIDKRGRRYYWPNTPSATTVHKGDGPMILTCEKKGFKKTTHSFDETLVSATLGNIILGGGIGILVDAASGAAQEYPTKVSVLMEPEDSAPDALKKKYQELKKELAEKIKKEKEAEKKEISKTGQ